MELDLFFFSWNTIVFFFFLGIGSFFFFFFFFIFLFLDRGLRPRIATPYATLLFRMNYRIKLSSA